MGKPKLLVVEDDPGLQKQLQWRFDDYEVLLAGDRAAALAQLRRHAPAVVTLDLGLPPDPDGASEGLAALQQMLAIAADTRIIILSGNQDRVHALKAIALGACDFHQKPFDADLLALVLARAFICMRCSRKTAACCRPSAIRRWPALSAATPACSSSVAAWKRWRHRWPA